MNKSFKRFKQKVGKAVIAAILVVATSVNSFAFANTTSNKIINNSSNTSSSLYASSSAQSSSSKIGTVTSTSLSVRKKASSSSTLLGKLYKGDTIIVLGETTSYYKINYKNQTGYILKKYVVLNSYLTSNNTIKTTATLNVRTGTNTSYSSLGKLSNGQIVTIKKVCSNGWYVVDFGNKMGFISPKYTQKVDDSTKNSDVICISKVINCDSLNIRSGASTSYKKLDEVLCGESVEVLNNSGSWAKIRYKNLTGYVLKKYITSNTSVDPIIPIETTNTIKTTAILNVRTGTSTSYSSLGKLSNGQVVTIKSTASNGWYKIQFGNKTGYISPKYTQKVDDNTKNSDVIRTTTINTDSLNIRAGQSTSYQKLDEISSGEPVDIVKDSSPKSGWTKIRYKNLNGYVSTKYLKSETPANEAPVVTANNITINCGSNFSFSMLNAKATDKEDGTITNLSYLGPVNPKKVGVYTATVTATDSQGLSASTTATVTVKAINPTVNASNVTINQGGTFSNSMLNASAKDCEGNTLNYTVKGTVNTSTAGVYTLYVSATDKWNLTTTRIVNVTVKEKSVVNTPPTITANNVTINCGDSYNDSMLNIKVTDKEDGNLPYISFGDEVNPNKVGTYEITISTSDSGGLSAKKTVTVTVKSVKPTITAKNATIEVGDSVTKSTINASAKDCEGTTLAVSLDKSNLNTSKAGTYSVKVSATDKWGNTATKTVQVTVKEKEVQGYKVNSPECRRIIQDEMYRLVNEHRANNGKSALTVSSALENTAYLKSEDMGINNYFDHQYNGKDIWEYKDCADADGENIAKCGCYGSNGKMTEEQCKTLASELFKMWKNSAGHNAAMLNKMNKLIGFDLYLVDRGNDAYTVYATQEFRIK